MLDFHDYIRYYLDITTIYHNEFNKYNIYRNNEKKKNLL